MLTHFKDEDFDTKIKNEDLPWSLNLDIK